MSTNVRTVQQRRKAGSQSHRWVPVALVGALILGSSTASAQKLSGPVKIDGSSTVAPITMAAAELFQAEQPRVRVTVGISGTGGGFKKFLDPRPDLRTDISDASRPIKKSELAKAKEVGMEFIEVPIAVDGIAVVINPTNDFCEYLTVDELKRIWEPGSSVSSWKDIRAEFPDMPLKLYGPGPDSGTFDYFTEVIVGKAKASRSDYTASESDNVLVQGVAGDPGALGYFGFSYYEANKDRLDLVAIDNNAGKPVKPSLDVIRSGKYRPLSRPLFIYVNKESYDRPQVRAYVEFILKNAPAIVEHPSVNYVALPPEMYEINLRRLAEGKAGTVVGKVAGEEEAGDLLELYRKH